MFLKSGMAQSFPPLISGRALGAMPEFIESEIGPLGLDRVISRSGLPYGVLENRDVFIPESMLLSFLDNAAREAGDDRLGLLMAPHITVADYDLWGSYLLGAPTLGDSLSRIVRTICLHSNDTVEISVVDVHSMKLTYKFGVRSGPGYDHIAVCAVAAVCSVFRFYLGAGWHPLMVRLDIDKPQFSAALEDEFRCPVLFGHHDVEFLFASEHLSCVRPVDEPSSTTVADIARARFGGAPVSAADKVRNLIELQLLDGRPDMEDAACKLDIGTRKLQRALEIEGTTFRQLANAAITERSMALLADSHLSITQIAMDLDYSSPAHFARAFRSHTGLSPTQYREQAL